MRATDYWTDVVNACSRNLDKLGAFPPPKLATVAAAEIIKLLLNNFVGPSSGYVGKMACGIVQLHDLITKQQTFVVAFSGYHPTLNLNLTQATTELIEAFQSLGLPVSPPPRFWYQRNPPSHYIPMHQATQTYFKNNLLVPVQGQEGTFEGVDVTERLIKFDDVSRYLDFEAWKTTIFEGKKKVLTGFVSGEEQILRGTKTITKPVYTATYGEESGSFSYEYRGSTARNKYAQIAKDTGAYVGTAIYNPEVTFDPLKAEMQTFMRGMLAAFLALRMDLIDTKNENLEKTVRAARDLIRQLKKTGLVKWKKLGEYLERVLTSPRLTAAQIDMQVTMDKVRLEGPRDVPDEESTKLTKGERKVLKSSMKMHHWKDVPTHARVSEAALVEGRNRLKKPTTDDLASAKNELEAELKDDKVLGDLLPQLWAASGAGPNGQFCAEPKAFDHVRNGTLLSGGIDEGKSRVVVVGQLAMWYANPGSNFSSQLLIIGPENSRDTSASGGYMLPCSSCSARSALMMEGLTLYNPDVEPPILHVDFGVRKTLHCIICGKACDKRCAGCRAAYYCNREHQVADWKRHKPFCVPK